MNNVGSLDPHSMNVGCAHKKQELQKEHIKDVEEFQDLLDQPLSLPKHHVKILLGYISAQLGCEKKQINNRKQPAQKRTVRNADNLNATETTR